MRSLYGGNDEYYTNPMIAGQLVEKTIKFLDVRGVFNPVFVEPSAGECAFSSYLDLRGNMCLAYDINPKGEYAEQTVTKRDFLAEGIEVLPEQIYVSIGNPPFGFACSKAIQFFNKCAEFSEFIAFIVPKTFLKSSIQNKLNPYFHLEYSEVIPNNAFLLDGEPHNVPCVFQIWQRYENPRKERKADLSEFLESVAPSEAEFAMRRVGGRAGQILEGFDYSTNTTYFFKEAKSGVLDALRKIDFSKIVQNTAGVRSLSKSEIAELLVAQEIIEGKRESFDV
jgi:predicted RNA methylase